MMEVLMQAFTGSSETLYGSIIINIYALPTGIIKSPILCSNTDSAGLKARTECCSFHMIVPWELLYYWPKQ